MRTRAVTAGAEYYKMTELTLREITAAAAGEEISPGDSGSVKGFSIDSRTIRPGEVFIAVKGENFDGHDFIRDASAKGASAIIAERFPADLGGGASAGLIRVPDALKAMGNLAGWMRKRSGLPVLCVTGTNGKTTVKEMSAAALSAKYNVLKSKRSYNNIIGLSLTLLETEPSHEIAVLEIGTNKPGEIAELGSIARPEAVIITNIGDGHLEAFGDRSNVLREKVSVLETMADDGTAFINGDDELLAGTVPRGRGVIFYGTSAGCDYRITGITRKDNGLSFLLNTEEYFIPAEGVHNVYNASAAIAAAGHFGVAPELIRKSLANVSLPDMRLQRINSSGLFFLNDSYNANPGSFESALETLRNTVPGSRKWVVAGEMLELGKRSEELHRSVGRSLAAKDVDFLIVLGKKAEGILEGALGAGMSRDRTYIASSHADAADMIRNTAPPGTVVLVKGSRKTRMEEVIKCFTSYCTS